jgi:Laminin B (Domain IV)
MTFHALYRVLCRSRVAAVLSLAALMTPAGWAATSTFDSGAEGWTSVFNGGQPLEWLGGSIAVNDKTDEWGYVAAPMQFFGDATPGAELSFDLRHEENAGLPRLWGVRVALVGAGLNLISELGIPGTNWARYSFDLASGGVGNAAWRVFSSTQLEYSSNAPLASAQQISAVLSGLQGIYIATDYTRGTLQQGQLDRTYLDNVTLTAAVPEPGAWALMLAGLTAVALGIRVRQRPLR